MKRRKPMETRGRFLVDTPIRQRPKEVRKCTTFGHLEPDTVVSSRGKRKACAATFVEWKTRLYFAVKMPNRTAHSMEVAFGVAASQYPQGTFKKDHSLIRKTKEMLQANLGHVLKLDEICKELYLSKSQFIRLFKAHTGISPYQYFLNCKVESAKKLIEINRDIFSSSCIRFC